MKKMSEVFELPAIGEDIQGVEVYNSQTSIEKETDDAIAHAINHVDELADVIENVLHHHGHALSYEIKSWCVDALASYRGKK